MQKIWPIFLFLVFSVACGEFRQKNEAPKNQDSVAGENADPYVARAQNALAALQSGLVKALTSAIGEGGPTSAVFVCRDEAPKIAATVTEETQISVGRTSHRLRNPQNAPPPWAEDIVKKAAEAKTEKVESHVLDLGDTIAVLKPINTVGLCTNCHGNSEDLDREVRQALTEAYPDDQATGFAVGDLRGWMWAEVTK